MIKRDYVIDKAYENLGNAVVLRAVIDYREAARKYPRAKREYEKAKRIVRQMHIEKNKPKTKEEWDLIKYRNRYISVCDDINSVKNFLLSDSLSLFTLVDGSYILKRLEKER